MRDSQGYDLSDFELFDVSDVTWDVQKTKDMRKIYLIMKSEEPFNLMRIYLALKEYVFKMESEIGVMDEVPEIQ